MIGDPSGNVFLVGHASDADESNHAIVRKLSVPPRLSWSYNGGQLRLSWPTNATDFVLQSATALTSGGDWQDFPTPPTEINGQKVVTITPTGPCGFFRLRRP